MRIAQLLLARKVRKRYPVEKYSIDEKVFRWNPQMDMELKQKVQGNILKLNSMECFQEMYNMMACLKSSEFDEANCTKEIIKYKKCNAKVYERISSSSRDSQSNTLRPGIKTMTDKQVNSLLSKYPIKPPPK